MFGKYLVNFNKMYNYTHIFENWKDNNCIVLKLFV